MLVLGIDPGLATTGYGLVAGDGQALEAVAYGVLRTPAHTPIAERLVLLHDELTTLLDHYRPNVVAMEELFFSTNARTAMTVGEARGVLLLTAAQAGCAAAAGPGAPKQRPRPRITMARAQLKNRDSARQRVRSDLHSATGNPPRSRINHDTNTGSS